MCVPPCPLLCYVYSSIATTSVCVCGAAAHAAVCVGTISSTFLINTAIAFTTFTSPDPFRIKNLVQVQHGLKIRWHKQVDIFWRLGLVSIKEKCSWPRALRLMLLLMLRSCDILEWLGVKQHFLPDCSCKVDTLKEWINTARTLESDL